MKKWLMIFLVAFSMIALAACSDNKEESKAENKQTERILKTDQGDVKVPMHPKRVIVDWNLGHVLATGMKPVGTTITMLEYGQLMKPYVDETVADIGSGNTPNVEKMLELKPDLIITWDPKSVEKYKKIAPTVVYDTSKYNGVHEELRAMGKILNREKETKEYLADFDKRVAVAKEKVEKAMPKDATYSIIDLATIKQAIVVGNTSERGGNALYEMLALKPSEGVKKNIIDKGESRKDVSWEKIGDYAGDYIFVITSKEKGVDTAPSNWKSLDAVKSGRVIEIDMKDYFSSDPISSLIQTEDMAEKLLKLQENLKQK
ncbi:Putatiave Fe3+-hydroxamate ABC transporter substrate-binding protein YxeB [Bacillus cereus]|uniref:ABC transporter substrate-binding protein n=1 Tax=Bacillus wiedmannii TaxID=1890302 RepID=UPI00065B53A2|nr:ABC transporter substrate-binding protein [Bacillus wiedmannii]KMP72634.1 hypothetical protein TU62_24330 [Bacillus cereus]MCQ6545925.1 ABC transporter substrate-binding protein [Bacillus wiedmannii]MCQ6574573.1 ABC transporter substrate-binding protein [Bacillus wiedmannii]MCU5578406.1 ABC transporter substrate-binding protein [Bacillus wiedmannii]WMS85231.1 ABC transporter substrate-binding protein [Bacillus wiedmannii]